METLDVTLTFSYSQVSPVQPGRYFRVLEDWLTADASMDDFQWEDKPAPIRPAAYRLPNGGGVPATRATGTSVWVPMPREFQLWFYEVWKIFAPPEMDEATVKQKWAAIWEDKLFQTNFEHGSATLADYINGTNLDKPPMARQTLVMRGNTLRLIDEDAQWLYFDAITTDVYKTMSPADYARDWTLCHFATVINNVQFDNGTWGMDRFPQLSIKESGIFRDVPTPVLALLDEPFLKLKRWQVEEVSVPDLKRPSPYNPPR